jgi:hypothetical protein
MSGIGSILLGAVLVVAGVMVMAPEKRAATLLGV